VEQNILKALEIADRIYLLKAGMVELEEKAQSINTARIDEAFFG
jgi:ABC-type branched-subunit amino acid transport system ATPase component